MCAVSRTLLHHRTARLRLMDEWLQDNDWGDLSSFKSQYFSAHWSTRGSETQASICRKETLQWPWLIIGFKLLFPDTRCHLGLSWSRDYWLQPLQPCCHSDQWEGPELVSRPIGSRGLMRINVLMPQTNWACQSGDQRLSFFVLYNYSVTFYVFSLKSSLSFLPVWL